MHMSMLHDHKQELDELIEVMHQKYLEVYRESAKPPATVFLDSAASWLGMISPDIFREYYLSHTKVYADIPTGTDSVIKQ